MNEEKKRKKSVTSLWNSGQIVEHEKLKGGNADACARYIKRRQTWGSKGRHPRPRVVENAVQGKTSNELRIDLGRNIEDLRGVFQAGARTDSPS